MVSPDLFVGDVGRRVFGPGPPAGPIRRATTWLEILVLLLKSCASAKNYTDEVLHVKSDIRQFREKSRAKIILRPNLHPFLRPHLCLIILQGGWLFGHKLG